MAGNGPLPTGGHIAIAVTPLKETGAIHLPAIDGLVEFYMVAGVSGIALLGIMGEEHRLSERERRAVVERAIAAVAGRVPVIVGVSSDSAASVFAAGEHATATGASGLILRPGPGLEGDDEVVEYFATIGDVFGPDVPLCVQDYPQVSGVAISAARWSRIVDTCPTVVMLKLEDEPPLTKLSEIRECEAGGQRRTSIFAGYNAIHLPQALGRAADGSMAGFAFPDVLGVVVAMHRAGRPEDAEDLFDRYLPINRYELSTGLAARKAILHRRGALPTPAARPPTVPLDRTSGAELDDLQSRVERSTGRSITEIVTAT